MASRTSTWWKKGRKSLTIVGTTIGIIGIMIFLFIFGLINGTGFGAYSTVTLTTTSHGVTKLIAYQGGKTLWDWLQLLIVPLALAFIAFLFNRTTTRTEQKIAADRYRQDQEIAANRYRQDQKIAAQRYKQDQQIALDKQREDLLQIYLDRMSELLLKEALGDNPKTAVKNVARVRTITILSQLDARRIGYVFAFLREAGLMSNTDESIVSLKGANLDNIDFREAILNQVDLSKAFLNRADLSKAKLYKANLSGTFLNKTNLKGTLISNANLKEADLSGADLSGADLSDANLSDADLSDAILFKADLSGANLSGTDLSDADLSFASLRGANLSFASLRGANLSKTNLYSAKITPEQIAQANHT